MRDLAARCYSPHPPRWEHWQRQLDRLAAGAVDSYAAVAAVDDVEMTAVVEKRGVLVYRCSEVEAEIWRRPDWWMQRRTTWWMSWRN